MREALQAGTGRTPSTVVVVALVCYAALAGWAPLRAIPVNPFDSCAKVAFVAGAFAVTAYNLRTRVVDLILKVSAAPRQMANFCMVARNCGKKLTNLVLLFTFAALLMGGVGFIPPDWGKEWGFGKWAFAISCSLFSASIVQFIYILFAFERLERFMLDDAENKSRKDEGTRLAGADAEDNRPIPTSATPDPTEGPKLSRKARATA